MKSVRKVAKILGPRGLMPSIKSSTLGDNVPQLIEDIKNGLIECKMDRTSNMSVIVGKRSFVLEKVFENSKVVIENINNIKPNNFKGIYIKSINISLSMSPSV